MNIYKILKNGFVSYIELDYFWAVRHQLRISMKKTPENAFLLLIKR
jgi:hypothetical protein